MLIPGSSRAVFSGLALFAIATCLGPQAVAKDESGPPAGDPISLEIIGEEFETLLAVSDSILRLIDESGPVERCRCPSYWYNYGY